jgi:transcriptional regulator with XRE-family HTH domain
MPVNRLRRDNIGVPILSQEYRYSGFTSYRPADKVRVMATRKSLAERLTFARNRARLTQEAVAERVGMSQSALADLESGKSKRTTRIAALANLYSCNAYWLETGETPTGADGSGVRESGAIYDDIEQRAQGDDEVTLLRRYRALSPTKKKAFLVLIEEG